MGLDTRSQALSAGRRRSFRGLGVPEVFVPVYTPGNPAPKADITAHEVLPDGAQLDDPEFAAARAHARKVQQAKENRAAEIASVDPKAIGEPAVRLVVTLSRLVHGPDSPTFEQRRDGGYQPFDTFQIVGGVALDRSEFLALGDAQGVVDAMIVASQNSGAISG